MAKDPAMLWYWSDWNSGTGLLSRFLKGCYMDILNAQFNNGRLSLEEIKICLGPDFGTAWPALQKKFKIAENGLFFNERLELEKNKRAAYTASRRNNLPVKNQELPDISTHMNGHISTDMDNENRNENTDLDLTLKSVKEKKIILGLAKNVKLTKAEYDKLEIELGEEILSQCIEYLSSYRAEKGYKSKEDNLTIRRWVIQAVMEKKKSIQKINGNGEKLSKNQSIRNSAEEAKRLIREDIANANEQGEDSN